MSTIEWCGKRLGAGLFADIIQQVRPRPLTRDWTLNRWYWLRRRVWLSWLGRPAPRRRTWNSL